MAGYKYDYTCPGCGNHLQFRTRVTMRRRRCPECGYPITPGEIDRQRDEQARAAAAAFRLQLAIWGGLGSLLVSLCCVFAACGALLKPSVPTSNTPDKKDAEPAKVQPPMKPRVEGPELKKKAIKDGEPRRKKDPFFEQ